MKKWFVIAVVLCASVMNAEAGQVNEQEARQKAMSFMSQRSMTRSMTNLSRVYVKLKTPSAMASVNDAPLYVFNLDGGGYLVVSGDDRTADVLAFSEKGHINPDKMPSNMKAWLDGYVRKIQKMPANVMPQQRVAGTRKAKEDIAPKLKTAWGQDWPYNLHTPELRVRWKGYDETVQSATGCNATAMAQMMNYYRYPDATLIGVDSYSGTSDVPVSEEDDGSYEETVPVDWTVKKLSAGLSIDWANITDQYDKKSSNAQIEAVSRLMQYCGAAIHTLYGMESEAKTDSLVYGLYEMFGYEDVYLLHQMNFDQSSWVDAIYDLISKQGPLLFGGDCPDDNGGHQFILDGYKNVDGKDYFYSNWGWDGDDDGYVLLDVMSPGWIFDEKGREIGFTEMQMATPGMGPNGKGQPGPLEKKWYCDLLELGEEGVEYTRSSKSDPFEVEYAMEFSNYDYPHQIFHAGLGIFQNGELIGCYELTDPEGEDLPLFYYRGIESDYKYPTFPLGEGLGDGTYQLKLICSVGDEDDWKVCRFGDEECVTMTIHGNTATFDKSSSVTAIKSVTNDKRLHTTAASAWYSLSGMRLSGEPSAKGVYLHNGRKIVIK